MKAGDVRIEMPEKKWHQVIEALNSVVSHTHITTEALEKMVVLYDDIAGVRGPCTITVTTQDDLNSMAQVGITSMKLPKKYWEVFINIKLTCSDCGEAFRPSFGLLLDLVEELFCAEAMNGECSMIEGNQNDLDSPLGAVLAGTDICLECGDGVARRNEKFAIKHEPLTTEEAFRKIEEISNNPDVYTKAEFDANVSRILERVKLGGKQ